MIAVCINEEDFSCWRMSYIGFVLFLAQLKNDYGDVDLYIPWNCEDSLFIDSLKNFNLKVNKQIPYENTYTFIVNWYNSIILSTEFNFVDSQYFNSINYIVSKKYNSLKKFYYCNSEIYFAENKDYYTKNNLIVDYIYTKNI
jgi:hypothetical protein